MQDAKSKGTFSAKPCLSRPLRNPLAARPVGASHKSPPLLPDPPSLFFFLPLHYLTLLQSLFYITILSYVAPLSPPS